MNPTPEPDTGEAEQLCLTPAADPDRLITEAKLRWSPIRTYCLFSGGSDSTALAHRCHPHYDALCYVDTGTAAEEGPGGPSVLAHVQAVAAWLEKPLVVIAAGDAYRKMVLGGQLIRRGSLAGTPERGHGFPGPGQHGKAYSRLKERQLEELVRRAKRGHPRGRERAVAQRRPTRGVPATGEADAPDGAGITQVREPADRLEQPGGRAVSQNPPATAVRRLRASASQRRVQLRGLRLGRRTSARCSRRCSRGPGAVSPSSRPRHKRGASAGAGGAGTTSRATARLTCPRAASACSARAASRPRSSVAPPDT